MIRPVLIEVLLFLAPFAIYAVFLVATRAGVLDPASWNPRVLVVLTVVALMLMSGSFFLLAHRSGHEAGSTYVPPHVKDGKLVPGHFK